MPINVSEAIDSDTAEVSVVERSIGGGYVNGIYQQNAVTTFKTLASTQQPTPEQLQMVPEGERDNNPVLFISKKSLRTTNDTDGTIADVLIYKGKRFKIIALADWSSYGHTHAFGVREK